MLTVNDVKLTSTVAFRMGVLGTIVGDRFAERLAVHDVKPKHVAMLSVLESGMAASQLEVAKIMRVAPSLVVSLADHLEGLGAVRRERDPEDRRRQVLALTEEGRGLLARCTALARAMDEELVGGLAPEEEAGLRNVLRRLASAEGLPE
ncbi:MarR family winged helix-turn-helix transcriptional regulator [Nonomuraea sp. NPDC050556]|uniref:MarR family winged helix-turn-helix transcriptional regulator n=1 Tax=Nonomuraea sp. NPDC050556 TaxID=3364369 RepID=UPI003799ED7C